MKQNYLITLPPNECSEMKRVKFKTKVYKASMIITAAKFGQIKI